MSRAVLLSDKLVGIPEKHKISMESLFYRIEAFGDIRVTTITSNYDCKKFYQVELKRNDREQPMAEQHTDFYFCLLRLYNRLVKEIERKDNKK